MKPVIALLSIGSQTVLLAVSDSGKMVISEIQAAK